MFGGKDLGTDITKHRVDGRSTRFLAAVDAS